MPLVPDGHTIRFTVWTEDGTSIWQVSPEGAGLHRLFPQWTDQIQAWGAWSPDQKYFVFIGAPNKPGLAGDIWAVREGGELFHLGSRAPLRLTNGPMESWRTVFSPDGKRIFFEGRLDRGELVRYDPGTGQWFPYLAGLAATQVDFSRDGKWIAYLSYPDASIWRSAADGSQKLQLTAPPLKGENPRWSPDGTQIACLGGLPQRGQRRRAGILCSCTG